MVIFTTNNNPYVLADCQILFMDGTFKAAPQIYQQLLSIHGQNHAYIVPLMFAPLGDKRKEACYEVIDYLKMRMLQVDLVLNFDE